MFTLFRKDPDSPFMNVALSPDDCKAEIDLTKKSTHLKKQETKLTEQIKILILERDTMRFEIKKIDQQLKDLCYLEDKELVNVINDLYKFIDCQCIIDRKNNKILIRLDTSRLMIQSSFKTAKEIFGDTLYINANFSDESIEVIYDFNLRSPLIERLKALSSKQRQNAHPFDETKVVEYNPEDSKAFKPLMM
jgi:hypothetical protein